MLQVSKLNPQVQVGVRADSGFLTHSLIFFPLGKLKISCKCFGKAAGGEGEIFVPCLVCQCQLLPWAEPPPSQGTCVEASWLYSPISSLLAELC